MSNKYHGRIDPKPFLNPSTILPDSLPPRDAGENETVVAWLEAVSIASELYSHSELAIWLTSPQPLLANWTPVQMLGCGRAVALRDVMRSLDSGAYL